MKTFTNPFRPGAGHIPPYLAGRQNEQDEFSQYLEQNPVMQNLILTGLRGVGKTVLLETFRPIAIQARWAWVGTDLSEAASVSEELLAIRILTDLAVFTSSLSVKAKRKAVGILSRDEVQQTLGFQYLMHVFNATPGLMSDKLKAVLELVWAVLPGHGVEGIVFAYDEAQNLHDSAQKEQYPLSLLLEVFQSIQRKSARFMLVLTGLPTLFPNLVEARTYSERMFHQVFLAPLDEDSSRKAIEEPIKQSGCPVSFDSDAVDKIVDVTGGYPYFIQFVCKEAYDVYIQRTNAGERPSAPINEIVRKLDSDFFMGRWARVTDRQRDLLRLVAQMANCETEFTVQEIVARSKRDHVKSFSSSHVNQMLASLAHVGIVYRNRHGKYSFAVPLLGQFIRRQSA